MLINKSIFVAGGTGFLGRYLVDLLVKRDLPVTVLTRNRHLQKNTSNCCYVETDYSLEHLSDVLSSANALVVLAAQRTSSSKLSDYFPSIRLCDNLYEAATMNDVQNIVYASSISVYSDLKQLPWVETSTLSPVSKYGISKVACEVLGGWYSRNRGLHVKNLRFAHLYGANEKNNYMINLFMRKAYHHHELNLLTPPQAKREFLYARDAATAIIAALEREDLSGCFNIGSADVLNNLQVAQIINKAFGSSLQISIKDPNAIETIESSYMDTSLSKKALGYTAQYTLETALHEIIADMESEDDIPILY